MHHNYLIFLSSPYSSSFAHSTLTDFFLKNSQFFPTLNLALTPSIKRARGEVRLIATACAEGIVAAVHAFEEIKKAALAIISYVLN